jgi:hypothetical protein
MSLHSYSAPQSETFLNYPKGNESQGVVEYHDCESHYLWRKDPYFL